MTDDDKARRAYWAEQMELGYAMVQQLLAFPVEECGERFASLPDMAAEAGVDGIMAVTPYYSKPGQEGLRRHFESIADASELPTLIYNIPGRTGRLIEVPTLARLASHPNIVATKDAVMDIDFTSQTLLDVPDMAVYSGQDSYTLAMMAVGAIGVVSVVSHLAGDEVAAMVSYLASDAAGMITGTSFAMDGGWTAQ